MSTPVNTHSARMALNQDDKLRQWAENWLKARERSVQTSMTDEEFEKHWLYVRPGDDARGGRGGSHCLP